MRALVRRWDNDSEGTVDYNGFHHWVHTGLDVPELTKKFAHQVSVVRVEALEDALNSTCGRGSSLAVEEFIEAIEQVGVLMSQCELWRVYAALDEDDSGKVAVRAVMDFIEAGSKGKKRKTKTKKEGDSHGVILLSKDCVDDIASGVQRFIDDADMEKSFGRILYEHADAKALSLNRRQLRKALDSVNIELTETDQSMLFER